MDYYFEATQDIIAAMAERVYWTQHAPIDRRSQEILGSGIDRGLSEFGVERARYVARKLARTAVHLTDLNETIVTSPLRRATQTSDILADELGFEVIVDDGLKAQHFGILEGMTVPEVLEDPALAPHLHRNLTADEIFTDVAPGGESIQSATSRMFVARRRLLAADGSPIAVTHGSVLNTLVGSSRGLPPKQWKDISAEFKGQLIEDRGEDISGVELFGAENILVILRGNSGSGKSTVAEGLRDKLGDNVLLISKDMLREEFITPESPSYYSVLGDMIRNLADIGAKYGYIVIIDGMVGHPKHDALLSELFAKFDKSLVYTLDIPLEETLRRHATRKKADEFGEPEMREWYRKRDHLGIESEIIVGPEKSRDEVVKMIVDQIKEIY
jgi:broad specificity phosphatase PhoE/predicted kinase